MNQQQPASVTVDGGGSQAEAPKSRKAVAKKLSTGNRITLTPQDDRTLKVIYDFISGYYKRQQIEAAIESKKREVEQRLQDIPPSARILMKQRAVTSKGTGFIGYGNDEELEDGVDGTVGNHSTNNDGVINNEIPAAVRSEEEIKIDRYYVTKDQLVKLEERLKAHLQTDHKIALKDLDAVIKSLGIAMPKKQIEQMIWEVDENLDELIDYDEFQLTYFRNITDTTGNEPNSFFKILEFMIFDGSHKGYIIEDDCMEILYARYGGGNLEKEMKLLFGNRLRAEGGDGTLNLEVYLNSVLGRTGRRALIF